MARWGRQMRGRKDLVEPAATLTLEPVGQLGTINESDGELAQPPPGARCALAPGLGGVVETPRVGVSREVL